jgi:hypothetical protein
MADLMIDGWRCAERGDSRFVTRESGAGSWHAWHNPDGSFETEFRPSEPDDDRRDVKLPAAVFAWLIRQEAK